jgi:putative CocE/NonD family hydrolase
MEELPYRFGVFQPAVVMLFLNLVGGRTLQTMPISDLPRVLTHRPLRDMDSALGRTNTAWRVYLEHDTFASYYRQLSLLGHFQTIDLPVLHITGWFDGDQWGQLFAWHGMVHQSPAAGRQWLVAGPWHHVGTIRAVQQVGERDFGTDAVLPFDRLHLDFFDRWLKGSDNGVEQEPRVRMFVMGANAWRGEDRWPPAGMTMVPVYVHWGGGPTRVPGTVG